MPSIVLTPTTYGPLTEDAPGRVCGSFEWGGVAFHLDAVRVGDDGKPAPDVGDDALSIWEDMQAFYLSDAVESVELPGFPGRYAVFIHPHEA